MSRGPIWGQCFAAPAHGRDADHAGDDESGVDPDSDVERRERVPLEGRKHAPHFDCHVGNSLGVIKKFRAQELIREKPLARKTINNHLTVLWRMLGVAVKWKRLA